MIQRIQTVLLILAIGLNIAFVFTPMFYQVMADPSAWISSGLISALLLATLFSLVSIFLYKNRLNQARWVKRSMMLQIIAIGIGVAVLFTLGGFGKYLWDETISLGLIVIALVLEYGAFHYIHKDDKLVRSMDRIR